MAKEDEEKRLLLKEENNHHHKISVFQGVNEGTIELEFHSSQTKGVLSPLETPQPINTPSHNDDQNNQQQPPNNIQNNDIKINPSTNTNTHTPSPPKPQASTTKKLIAVLFWIFFSALTLILNKLLFSVLSFPYPITLTMVHTLLSSILAFLVTAVFKWIPLVKQDRSIFFTQVVPLAIIFCVNIVIGNTALEYIHISFNQTIKSTVPVFTVLINMVFLSKSYQPLVYASLLPVVGGVAMASFAEVNFHIIGFLCSVVSSGTTALSLIFAGLLLEGGSMKKMDPINLLLYMAPTSFVILLPLSFTQEWSGIYEHFSNHPEQITRASFILLGSGVIAFLLNYSTFIVASLLSSLALVVTGNIKAVTNIIISVLIFRNKMSTLNVFGCIVALSGAAWFQHITSKKPLPVNNNNNNNNTPTNNNNNNTTTLTEGHEPSLTISQNSPNQENHNQNDMFPQKEKYGGI